MSHTHVCLVSDQPIPNLTTALHFKPDVIVLLTTKEIKEKAISLEKVLKQKGFQVQSKTIDAYNISNVIDVSESLLKENKDGNITLNITGGTKIGTLGTFQAFYTQGNPIFYVNTKDNKILKLFPEHELEEYPINVKIPIIDYLAVYGFIVDSFSKDNTNIKKRKKLTFHLAHNASGIVGDLNYHLHNFNEQSPLPVIAHIPKINKLGDFIGLLENVKIKDDSKVIVSDYNDLRYLKGIWFEEYVYLCANELGADEVLLNVTGKWVTKGIHPPKNEFDILMAKGTRLFYISCKTANPNRKKQEGEEGIGREYLYELDSITDNALGLFGKKMLASARKIDDPYVRERAKILKIEIVDGRNIITLQEKLKQWLQR